MKIARFNGGKIGVVVGERIVDVSAAAGVNPHEWPPVGIVRVIADFDALRPAIEAAAAAGSGIPLADAQLETPIPWPNKLLALPNNYAAHTEEMRGRSYAIGSGAAPGEAGFFMKANSSMVGPMDAIVLPDIQPERMFHHECELAVIVGKRARNVKAADAADYIFGYACLLDMTMRGKEERVMRKSYESFTPVGPWITTSDEVGADGRSGIATVGKRRTQTARTRARDGRRHPRGDRTVLGRDDARARRHHRERNDGRRRSGRARR